MCQRSVLETKPNSPGEDAAIKSQTGPAHRSRQDREVEGVVLFGELSTLFAHQQLKSAPPGAEHTTSRNN
ncbi:hypothetical protein J6590_030439 [Homalodisca vitripennis]|nr:hypothetical protein J6590_030439 [Homalodisca vitripennis]